MSVDTHFAYPAQEPQTAVTRIPRSGFEPWRLGAAAAVVGIVVCALWLWGRPRSEPPLVLVAVTAETWIAGQPPTAFDVVTVPLDVATRFVEPDAIADRIVAHDVPEGTFVTPELLTSAAEAVGTTTVMRFVADTTAWPPPGPSAGSHAVVSTVLGGCAVEVSTLFDAAEDSIVVRVDPQGAAHIAAAAEPGGLVVWPSPPDGWPLCRSAVGAAEIGELASPFATEPSDGDPALNRSER